MDFEWDEEKNTANQEKHLISFEEAVSIFDGPVLRVLDDRKDYGEERYIVHGALVLERGRDGTDRDYHGAGKQNPHYLRPV